MPGETKKRTNLDVDVELWRQFSALAAAAGKTKSDLLDEVLRKYVEQQKGK